MSSGCHTETLDWVHISRLLLFSAAKPFTRHLFSAAEMAGISVKTTPFVEFGGETRFSAAKMPGISVRTILFVEFGGEPRFSATEALDTAVPSHLFLLSAPKSLDTPVPPDLFLAEMARISAQSILYVEICGESRFSATELAGISVQVIPYVKFGGVPGRKTRKT